MIPAIYSHFSICTLSHIWGPMLWGCQAPTMSSKDTDLEIRKWGVWFQLCDLVL